MTDDERLSRYETAFAGMWIEDEAIWLANAERPDYPELLLEPFDSRDLYARLATFLPTEAPE